MSKEVEPKDLQSLLTSPSLRALLQTQLAKLRFRIEYINQNIVSNVTALDKSLASLGYLLLFVTEAVKRLPLSSLVKSPLWGQLRILSGLISDIRIFNRLWGMIPTAAWSLSTWNSPPKDKIIKWITWLQIGTIYGFQPLENVAYLMMKKIVRFQFAGTANKEKRNDKLELALWLWSCRFWAAYVLLDFAKLYRNRQLRQLSLTEFNEAQLLKAKSRESEKDISKTKNRKAKLRESEEKAEFLHNLGLQKRADIMSLVSNLSYLPLTIHWSLERGCCSDIMVGLLGFFGACEVFPHWKTVYRGSPQ
ncbi:hypothetical protein NADFUDRAFT_50572 [Nadsonia fulvescens var. elongata DSM 6958]|uniref:Uncharacterized protein n=1 Tax=Nadsonia fulvescens var. elongata DSM 6958 TaxID=857566 RepID=A0A1E3PP13_9ASCO|nr:hypothetical protein NADFUDRAFT_50572 [Nadsonia fulvescens var. elongata DSM 6958]